MNSSLARQVLQSLISHGVREFCVCPGSRNAPLVTLLAEKSEVYKTFFFYEERSAAFFALGRIESQRAPVAVVTTSGTAAGELLPATMEAHYSGLPLVLLTADRPKSYRGTGAPQSAEQVGIYSSYVEHSFDLENSDHLNLSEVRWNRPIHINLCFDEPLLEGSYPPFKSEVCRGPVFKPPLPERAQNLLPEIHGFFKQAENPWVIVGMLPKEERESTVQLLLEWNLPCYLEGPSGIREDSRIQHLRVYLSDGLLQRAERFGYPLGSVIRIGGVPTLRLWRDLEKSLRSLPVLSLSLRPFSGLSRPSLMVQTSVRSLVEENFHLQKRGDPGPFLEEDHFTAARLDQLLEQEPQSEPGMFAALSRHIPKKSRVYLGNSLPIREWDLAATRDFREFEVWASRGVNGIDGQVSSFLGFAQENVQNWGVLGDLTALYDLPGPWILPQLGSLDVRILVVNNGGGKIFSKMYPHPEFVNSHSVRFKPWADLWGLQYEEWNRVPSEPTDHSGPLLVEMLPDEDATKRFWEAFRGLSS